MKVSVIIPSYNSESTIRNCLISLLQQSYPGETEIILVDSSIDSTPEIINEFHGIIFFHFDKKTDPGTARNKGIQLSGGDILLFIDSDCTAEKQWIEKIVNRHLQFPEVAGVGGAVENGNHPDDVYAWAGYFAEFREFLPRQKEAMVRHIPTLNISYKRWVFEENGFFDPGFYPQEDLVFNFLLTEKYQIFFDPDIRVHHVHRCNFNSFLGHQKRIGRITAQVLKIIPLPGSGLVKRKYIFFWAGPALPFIKYFRTLSVILKLNPAPLWKHSTLFVVLFIGMVFWFAGFWRGVFSPPLKMTVSKKNIKKLLIS